MNGPVQTVLIMRAGSSKAGNVMPTGARERKALRRLERRGAAAPVPGLPDVWRVVR